MKNLILIFTIIITMNAYASVEYCPELNKSVVVDNTCTNNDHCMIEPCNGKTVKYNISYRERPYLYLQSNDGKSMIKQNWEECFIYTHQSDPRDKYDGYSCDSYRESLKSAFHIK
ncbi:hypothetical protein [Shewanella halifaxensis]|uniref:hypothetical protein n=1 Tax=Shewanella halifaxensis TaxID=271098 RepID=UPI000D59D70F|nr:hypothetical protein [Shewanella halifaxensis]